ncbi:MAG: glycoside hydrolase family 3 C-terminal domain-containing protein [Parvibaculaceae bacterium]
MAFALSDEELKQIIEQMTDAEKADLLSGNGLWRTAANYRLNIPETIMTDGTYGVRYSADQIDDPASGTTGLQQFLEIENQRPKEAGTEITFGSTKPATCFPNGSSFACSWDVELAYALGAALAAECHHLGINLLLGPGINIRRMPLAGRSYEYYSEDPVVAGDIAAGVINGLQDNGVGASLKHFACNNSEIERTTMSSDVDERALREIYLAGFERAIAKSRPWTVMSSYNRLNGVQAAENKWLLTDVLRDEWGYDGLVVSDWYAIKDRPQSLRAGNDLDMPESPARRQALLAAIKAGEISPARLDEACLRVLHYIRKAKMGEKREAVCDFPAHHLLARKMASEALVLAKNDRATLPIVPGRDRRILMVGSSALRPIIQGSGSATTRPTQVDIPLDELRALIGNEVEIAHCAGTGKDAAENDRLREEALALAGKSDLVIVFANPDIGADGEGSDRADLRLAPGQDRLITALCRTNVRVVVVLTTPDAVELPWLDDVAGLIISFFPGQGYGRALADILTGSVTPSGKLTVSFPRRLEDVPGYHAYPGENGHHPYSEGIFVGYRYYDLKGLAPALPFGHGLSYTEFAYSQLSLSRPDIALGQDVTVAFDVANVGARAGKEVVQVYVRPNAPALRRPPRELKAFRKVALEPGEKRRVEVTLSTRDFQHYDTAVGRWVLRAGSFDIEIAASSRDIRLSANLPCVSESRGYRRIERETQPIVLSRNPAGTEHFLKFLMSALAIDRREAETLFEYCKSSFLGIPDTLAWFVGSDAVNEDKVLKVIDEINQMSTDE